MSGASQVHWAWAPDGLSSNAVGRSGGTHFGVVTFGSRANSALNQLDRVNLGLRRSGLLLGWLVLRGHQCNSGHVGWGEMVKIEVLGLVSELKIIQI